RQIDLEVEARAPPGARLQFQVRFHRQHELAADREAQPGLREQLGAAALSLAQRLEQRRDLLSRDASAAVAHRKLYAVPFPLLRDDLDVALIGKLEGVGREVQQNAAQRDRVTHALIVGGREQ